MVASRVPAGSARLALALLIPVAEGASPPLDDAFVRVASRVAATALAGTPGELAGKYTAASELEARAGRLPSGEDLYLFPDQTYLHARWTARESVTVHDKGTWALTGSRVELVSDPEVSWTPDLERRHLLVRRTRHLREAILVGLERGLPRFEAEARDDPELALLLAGLKRILTFDASEAATAKAELMRAGWRPWEISVVHRGRPAGGGDAWDWAHRVQGEVWEKARAARAPARPDGEGGGAPLHVVADDGWGPRWEIRLHRTRGGSVAAAYLRLLGDDLPEQLQALRAASPGITPEQAAARVTVRGGWLTSESCPALADLARRLESTPMPATPGASSPHGPRYSVTVSTAYGRTHHSDGRPAENALAEWAASAMDELDACEGQRP